MGHCYFCLEKEDCLVNHGFCRFCRFAKSAKSARPPGNRQVAKREAFFKHDAVTLLAVGIAARDVSFLSQLPLAVEPFTFFITRFIRAAASLLCRSFGGFAEFADFCRFCRFLQIFADFADFLQILTALLRLCNKCHS